MARKLLLGMVALFAGGLVVYFLQLLGGAWIPPRNVGGIRRLGAAFVLCDVALVAALILLLVHRENWPPRAVEGVVPLRGRWSWYLITGAVVLAYLLLGPGFLWILVRMKP